MSAPTDRHLPVHAQGDQGTAARRYLIARGVQRDWALLRSSFPVLAHRDAATRTPKKPSAPIASDATATCQCPAKAANPVAAMAVISAAAGSADRGWLGLLKLRSKVKIQPPQNAADGAAGHCSILSS